MALLLARLWSSFLLVLVVLLRLYAAGGLPRPDLMLFLKGSVQ